MRRANRLILYLMGGGVLAMVASAAFAQMPSPRFMYVANSGNNTVSIYAVDAASGQMRANGYVLTGGIGPFSVTVDPTGRFVYVANFGSHDVSAFSINPTSGAPTAAPAGPVRLL